MEARVKLNEYAEMQGWDKNKLIGWSEAADFAEWFAALRQPPVSGSVADAVGRNCPFCGEPCVECSHKATDR